MDHSTATLMELNDSMTSRKIASNFTHTQKVDALHRSENLMHNKEQQQQEAYYKALADEILKFDHVLLFGPTNAKVELSNYVNKDRHFRHIIIDVEAADKMTDNEKFAFVKNHFA